MRVLIAESDPALGWLWKRHLERGGSQVTLVTQEDEAIDALASAEVDIIILDLVIEGGSAFAVADFAAYRCPLAKVIFVTNTTFFSDGSIFQHISNACAYLPTRTPPEDLAAMVEHYGTHG
ncbi:hypothetical protein [Pseudogemmobacter sp. W21_MBD1_M6]|uniref:hypothetical protein n=1 Tax=Pseudogemmobacter sp. W21_MBD1_M6 TaxID=3240271 RepID=UPI003F9D3CC8